MRTILSFILIITLVSAKIKTLDTSVVNKIFKDKVATIILFTANTDQSQRARKIFSDLSQTTSDLLFVVSNDEDENEYHGRIAQYLGVDLSIVPKIIYLSSDSVKYLFNEQISSESLESFLTLAKNNKLSPYLKSAPIPESNDQPVKIIVGKNFKQFVLDSDKQFLIEFYAPWCGHCKHLAPKYDYAAQLLKVNPNIVLAKMDSTKNEIAGVSISGFPTLKFWRKDKSLSPIDYTGQRETDGIIDWLKENTQYEWIQIQDEAEL